MDKEGMVYTYIVEYYSAIKNNEIRPFAATWMDLESVILSEVSQTDKEKCHMAFLIRIIWKEMIQMNLQNRHADLENKLMVVRRKDGGRES